MSETTGSNAIPHDKRPSHRMRWSVAGAIGLAGALGVTAFMVLPGVSATPSDKVTICHATSSTSNPYTVNTISTSSVDEKENKYLNGHGDHTGPVFEEGMKSGWGDIIPPFKDEISGVSFPGYNWTAGGQEIWNAGCAYASPSPSPTETSATPTPTTTSPTPTPTTTSPTPTPTPVRITICHATSSTTNPYTVNTIDTSSVDEEGNQYLNGHGDHTGPVFMPGMTTGWGDIIPPFTHAPSGTSFPGYNWTSAGQAILQNDCAYTTPSPSPTPTSATPTPTQTSATPTPTQTSATPTPITTSPAPITTSPAPITTSPAPTFPPFTPDPTPITTSPAPITTSPAPITTSPAPITTSPAPITTSPAPITTSPAPSVSPTPSTDDTATPPAPIVTGGPTGGLPQSVPAGGGPGDAPGKPAWLWLVAAAFLALPIASLRHVIPGRDT